MITPADTEGRIDEETITRLLLLDVSVVAAVLAQHHLSLSSVRNQVCVAKVTSAKLPAMTEQREPFCFIDCSSFGRIRDSHIRELDGNNNQFVIIFYWTDSVLLVATKLWIVSHP